MPIIKSVSMPQIPFPSSLAKKERRTNMDGIRHKKMNSTSKNRSMKMTAVAFPTGTLEFLRSSKIRMGSPPIEEGVSDASKIPVSTFASAWRVLI